MNKQKRNIITLQATAMRKSIKKIGPIPLDWRKEIRERFKEFGTMPIKAVRIVGDMRTGRVATVLRACCFESHGEVDHHRPNGYYVGFFTNKNVMLCFTSRKWLHEGDAARDIKPITRYYATRFVYSN